MHKKFIKNSRALGYKEIWKKWELWIRQIPTSKAFVGWEFVSQFLAVWQVAAHERNFGTLKSNICLFLFLPFFHDLFFLGTQKNGKLLDKHFFASSILCLLFLPRSFILIKKNSPFFLFIWGCLWTCRYYLLLDSITFKKWSILHDLII